MKRVAWTAASGQDINIDVYSRYVINDRGIERTRGPKEVDIKVSLAGRELMHTGLAEIDHPTCVAKIGKVGLNAERYELVRAAIAEVEAEISDHNDKCQAMADRSQAVADRSRAIEQAMRAGE